MSEKIIQILAVEDDALDRKIIKNALRDSGVNHELTFAVDHETGVTAATGKEYDCIFLDYNLPGGTGLELLKVIRASGNSSPIIVVTSQSDARIAAEIMKYGADEYIQKDFLSKDGIAQCVRFMVSKKEQAAYQRELENKLKQTQKQLNTVVVNAPIILFSLDQNGEFQVFEGKGLDNINIDKSRIINTTLDQQYDLPILYKDFLKAMSGHSHTVVVEWKELFFEIFYSPLLDEEKNITGVLGIASNITIYKKAEEELQKAKKLAEETARVKEQFLANMSHEIRTPMNGIIGLTRILLNTTLQPEQLRYMQSIKSCSDNLLVIINDILDFSKIEAGKMNFESVPFRVEDIATQTIELFQVKADEKGLQLTFEKDTNIPEFINGDPTRLNQILNNLVSNAIKFTEKGEVRLRMRLTASELENVSLCFEVKDSGIGIPEKSLPTIFDSFTQASSDTTRKFGGTGLGLTIVKRMIELQGGDISVKSKMGSGTTFSFIVPYKTTKSVTAEIKKINYDHLSTSHLRILIAEDNMVNQIIVKKVLSDWNTEADFAENGVIALELLQKNDYDIIFMDIQMPEMDGYTAVQKIRDTFPESKRYIPILAMTAHATSTERQKCLDAGMDEYISKPFEPGDLKKKIIALTESLLPPEENTYKTDNFQPKNNKMQDSPGTDGLTVKEKVEVNAIVAESPINLSYLKKIAEGNESFMIEMIEMFLNKTPSAIEQMTECLQNQNWSELRSIAHRIKPSFGYIGKQNIQSALSKIETCAEESGNRTGVDELIREVSTSSLQAFEELRKELVNLK